MTFDPEQFRLHNYILDKDGQPVPCDDLLEWGRWMETAERRVAQDKDEQDEHGLKICVSTIFLGVDHRHWGDGPPILWETMVFGGVLDGAQERYTSLEEALVGHQEMCARVSETLHP
jgi:hypothetical protein